MDELAPRDEVARAIQARLQATGERSVGLDMRAIDPAHFPNVVAALREAGLDPTRELIPVAPAAHYMMGGIVTDLDGRSTVAGLYAVGEASCTGLHGANRLASNSLSECFVFARRAVEHALVTSRTAPHAPQALGARRASRAEPPAGSRARDTRRRCGGTPASCAARRASSRSLERSPPAGAPDRALRARERPRAAARTCARTTRGATRRSTDGTPWSATARRSTGRAGRDRLGSARVVLLATMAEGDRLILATDRCSTCGGAGWTWWSAQPELPERGKWVVCRSCLGTGRNDQTGAKRQMPAHVPSEQPHDPPADLRPRSGERGRSARRCGRARHRPGRGARALRLTLAPNTVVVSARPARNRPSTAALSRWGLPRPRHDHCQVVSAAGSGGRMPSLLCIQALVSLPQPAPTAGRDVRIL